MFSVTTYEMASYVIRDTLYDFWSREDELGFISGGVGGILRGILASKDPIFKKNKVNIHSSSVHSVGRRVNFRSTGVRNRFDGGQNNRGPASPSRTSATL